MGDENIFTFTGLLKDEPKKEPSVELITTVKVPRHEYALLVAAKAKLDLVEKMVNGMDSYAAFPVLKLLFSEEDVEE